MGFREIYVYNTDSCSVTETILVPYKDGQTDGVRDAVWLDGHVVFSTTRQRRVYTWYNRFIVAVYSKTGRLSVSADGVINV